MRSTRPSIVDDKTLTFLLTKRRLRQAREGRHPLIRLIGEIAEQQGFRVEHARDTPLTRKVATARRHHTITHMSHPPGDRGLCFRNCYAGPFWQIERSGARWEWDVTHSCFDPDSLPADEAASFFRFWRKRLYGTVADQAVRENFIYVPLQGRLLTHRSFQSYSPIEMLRILLARDARPVRATLHPNETYSVEEMEALRDLTRSEPRLQLDPLPMIEALARCDLIVTQNSSAAFHGLFFGKPAITFAGIDFHHATFSVPHMGLDQAFAAAAGPAPDAAKFLLWFWRRNAINMGRDDRMEAVSIRLRRFGWPV